jgi:DNA-binding PadR family transcriptional regulator
MNQTTFQVLAVLRNGSQDAGQILDALRDLLGQHEAPPLASFYRAVKRSLEDNLIHIVGSAAGAEGPGRRSQVYAITDRGIAAAEAQAGRLRALAALALGNGGIG